MQSLDVCREAIVWGHQKNLTAACRSMQHWYCSNTAEPKAGAGISHGPILSTKIASLAEFSREYNDNKLLFGQRAQWFFLRQLLKLVTFYREVGQQHTTMFESFLKSFHSLTRNETSKSYSEYHSRVWCKRYVAALPLVRISEPAPWLAEETHRARLKIHRTEMYLNMAIQDVSKHHHHPPDAAWNTIQGDALKIICN